MINEVINRAVRFAWLKVAALLLLLVSMLACQQPLPSEPDFTTDFDLVAPNSSLVNGVTATTNTTPTWNWSTGGNGVGVFRYRLNGGAWTIATALNFTPGTPLAEGAYIFEVSERDDRGNWSEPVGYETVIDLTAPAAPVITSSGSPYLDGLGNPVPNTVVTSTTQPVWSWSGSGGGNGTYIVDSAGVDGSGPVGETAITSFQPAGALTTGTYTLRVQERDAAGNWSAFGEFSVVVDTSIPTLTLLDDTGTLGDNTTNVSQPSWQITSGTGPTVTNRYRWRMNGGPWNPITGTSPFSFTLPVTLPDGSHTLDVQQERTDSTFSGSATATITVDTVAPGASNLATVESNPTGETQPTWTWSSAAGGAGRYEVDSSAAGGSAPGGETTNTSYTPASPLANGTYSVSVRERDAAGNWNSWTSRSITITNLAPTANAGPNQSGIIGQAISFSGAGSSDPEGDPLSYSWSVISSPAGSTVTPGPTNQQTFSITVDTLGSYMVELTVSDAYGSSTDQAEVSVTYNPIVSAGLLAYYPMDGNAADYGPNGYTGTINGATAAQDRAGRAGRALSFDGVNDVVDVAAGTFSGNNSVSVSFWMNVPTLQGLAYFLRNGNGGVGFFSNGTNGGLAISITATSSATGPITLGTWHHVVGTYDGTTIRYYIDGTEVGTVNHPGLIGGTGYASGGLTLGLFNSVYWNGIIDDLRFYDRVISVAEINQLLAE